MADSLDQAETDLIEVLRLNDAQNFTLSVTCRNGWWQVITTDLDQSHPDLVCEGRGRSFSDAWHNQKPAWAVKVNAEEASSNG